MFKTKSGRENLPAGRTAEAERLDFLQAAPHQALV
jgi:hypothetical protein